MSQARRLQSCYAMLIVKPEATQLLPLIKDYLSSSDFDTIEERRIKLPYEKADEIYKVVKNQNWPGRESYLKYITSAESTVLFLFYRPKVPDAQVALKELTGATNPEEASKGTLRNRLKDPLKKLVGNLDAVYFYFNGVHVADDGERAAHEALTLFGKDIQDFLIE
jgi:nucleoside diphosphate kinase